MSFLLKVHFFKIYNLSLNKVIIIDSRVILKSSANKKGLIKHGKDQPKNLFIESNLIDIDYLTANIRPYSHMKIQVLSDRFGENAVSYHRTPNF